MGIRFYCPNGHKLNVKAFQAGKRGICPYCGTRFLIPTQSTRKSSKDELTALRSIASASSQAINPASQNVVAGDMENAPISSLPISPLNPSSLPPVINMADGDADGGPEMLQSADSPAAWAQTPAADPFKEAGDVVWYVRPTSGGQYGPATGNVMRQWLAEGRVSFDTLIWREGWRDWQQAAAVFPQLRANDPSAESAQADVPLMHSGSSQVSGTSRYRMSQNMRILIIIFIILAVIIIASVILWAVTGGTTLAGENSHTPSTRLELRDTLSSNRIL